MKGFKNFLASFCFVLIVSTAIVYSSTWQHNDQTIIRIGHDSKVSSPIHQAMLMFKTEVEKTSVGNISVEIYPGQQLGNVRETTELVQQGNLQMTVGASVLLTSIVPEFNVLDLFYLFEDLQHAHRSLDHQDVGGQLLEAMENKGFYGLGFMEAGFRSLTTNVGAVNSLNDLDPLTIRSASNPTQIDAWQSVDVSPIPLSFGEIFTSLQQGLINGQESTLYSIFAERFYEAQTHLSLSEHIYTNYVWYINLDFWNNLTSKQQKIIKDVSSKTIKFQRELADKQNTDIIAILEQKGMKINSVPPEVRTQMGQLMNNAIIDEIRKRTTPELFDNLTNKIKKMRYEHEE